MNSPLGYRVRLVRLLSVSKGYARKRLIRRGGRLGQAIALTGFEASSLRKGCLAEIDAKRLGTLKSSQFLTRLSTHATLRISVQEMRARLRKNRQVFGQAHQKMPRMRWRRGADHLRASRAI